MVSPGPEVQRVVLVGAMGAGKTTVGRLLARRLDWAFVDTDELVVTLSGRSVAALFEEGGEPFFRQWERQAIATLFARERLVIASGGGALTDAESRGFLQALGPLVWLDAPVETLWQRAGGDPARPLAQDQLAFAARYAERRALYARCPLRIDTARLDAQAAASRLHEQLFAGAGELVVGLGDRSYGITVRPGSLHGLPAVLGAPSSCLVVTDQQVEALYAEAVMAALRYAGWTATLASLPPGEPTKSFEQAQALYDACVRIGLRRHQPIVALGGGVIGDLAGFVAATYQRGVPFVQVPTTLLAQIDSAVGGKVAINHPRGKNLIGAFYQPRHVLVDTSTLLTLDAREYRAGLAELVKYGVIMDAALFARLEAEVVRLNARDLPLLNELVARACALKAEVVGADEREEAGGRRAILNFGHTVGHAIEAIAGYGRVLHGEAVAMGMLAEGDLAVGRGLWRAAERDRLAALLAALGLETTLPALDPAELLDAMGRDKKNRDAGVTFVLPTAMGEVVVQALPAAEVARWIASPPAAGSQPAR